MQNNDQLNPWFSMWNRPRDTIQKIVDSDDPENMVLLLAAVGGVSSSLNSSSSNFVGDQFSLMSILLPRSKSLLRCRLNSVKSQPNLASYKPDWKISERPPGFMLLMR